MPRMKAARVYAYGGTEQVALDLVNQPDAPAENQLLIKVRAAGVNGIDWKIRDGLVKDAFPLPFPISLGIEFVGQVVAIGAKVERFKEGDLVLGPVGGLGSYAEFILVSDGIVAKKPSGLSDTQAAALPIAALTANQALFEAGRVEAGQRVLIHGSAGSVGGLAVQLAHSAGAHVVATASRGNIEYVRNLGANEVYDYRLPFEEHIKDVDFVLDLVGGDSVNRLWNVLNGPGQLITTAAPEIEGNVPAGRRGKWIRFHPDADRLAQTAERVAAGEIHVEVGKVFPFDDVAAAIEHNKREHTRGKIVIDFPD